MAVSPVTDLGYAHLLEQGRTISDEEQKLFISFMLSCGICFTHRQGKEGFED